MENELSHDEIAHNIDQGKYLGDAVYGANDGIITTFAVISGAAGAGLSTGVILILGIANLVADGISMGMSNYLSLKSREDFQKKQRAIEEYEVEKFPEKEIAEMHEIVERWRVSPENKDMIVSELTKDKKIWVDIMMREELGIMEHDTKHAMRHGIVTAVAFAFAGALPLIPYLFGVPADSQFLVSVIATAVALFAVGSARAFITSVHWFKSGLQMLGIGALAAISAYVMGALVKNILGITI